MFLGDFIFVVSHLEIHPAVHLNTSKALMSLYTKRNARSIFVCWLPEKMYKNQKLNQNVKLKVDKLKMGRGVTGPIKSILVL